jgi:hypothetical protein
VKNVLATKLNDCLFAKTLDIADNAVGICVISKCFVFVLSYTVLVKARWMFCLPAITIARMSAFKEGGTALPRLPFALAFGTNVLPALDGSLTKTALLHVLLLFVLGTSLSNMIWLGFAPDAKVFAALVAADTVRAHVLRGSLVNGLSLIVLVIVVNVTLGELDGVSAFASDYPVLLVKQL